MSDQIVQVSRRESHGKNVSRRLRRNGEIPAIVYGAGKEAVSVTVDPDRIVKILRSESGANSIFQLSLAGTDKTRHVMIKEYQVDPVGGHLLHADLLRINMDKVIEVSVPIRFTGEATGVKLDGGILEHVSREVEISSLPGDIPEHIDVDVTSLKIGDHIKVSDLPESDRYRVLTDAGQTLVVCIPPAKEETAEAAAVEGEAAPTEPEVLKKGKADAESTEEGEKESK